MMPIIGGEGKEASLIKFASHQLWLFSFLLNTKDKKILLIMIYFWLPEWQLPIWLLIILFHYFKEIF